MVFRHQRVSEDGLACIERDTHTQPYVHRLHGRDAEEKLYEEGVQSYRATVMLKGLKMLCLVWTLAMAMLCVLAMEVSSQCWESAYCQDLSSEENMLECIQLCRSDLTAETPVYPGDGHLQPPEQEGNDVDSLPALPLTPAGSPQDLSEGKQAFPRHEEKRSYSMQHFRWGKPVGRKRRPINGSDNGAKDESAKALPAEMRRDADYGLDKEENMLAGLLQQKKDGSYKMNHFRWSGPPASKRYGGFMKSWDERSQKPLLTLFKNVINKDAQQKKDQ
ncbi:pro-opiomelanocortin-2-like [Clupea harengus]|uniref:Pro-opiomelanocortin-2-like n=1 Tax=Clupea harengus TaxID=7950 RepID=A0A6P3W8L1_CLUHA|nr:pro-opiomelanocortin-2-like [Clupea harengus]